MCNGVDGGNFQCLSINNDSNAIAFIREKGQFKVMVICNLSGKNLNLKIKDRAMVGNFKEIFSGVEKVFNKKAEIKLTPWEYLVYENK